MSQHEVTNQEYLEAVQWAYDNGYVTATSSSVRDNLDGSTVVLLDLDRSGCELSFSGGTFTLRDAGHGVNPDHPAKTVCWYGAVRYCDWLSLQERLPRAYAHTGDWSCNGGDPYGAAGYRLPTDAEWEYAVQYNDDRIYPWGNEPPDCGRANFGGICVGWTANVGSYPGAPLIGDDPLFDMAGNVKEWTNDWAVCDLGTLPQTDPVGPASGSSHVVRGGSWDVGASNLLCAARPDANPANRGSGIGFRFARSAP